MKNIILLVTVFLASSSYAQTIERQLIGSSGGSFVNSTIDLNYSIGETVITTESSGALILTQGFQQEDDGILGVDEFVKVNNVLLYPNPVSGSLSIQFIEDASKSGNVSVTVYDNQGKVVFHSEEKLNVGFNNTMTIDLSSLIVGYYIVHIKDADGVVSIKNIAKI